MGKLQETVLYYRPEPCGARDGNLDDKQVRLLKSVLVRMGIRIKNIRPEQLSQTVGYLAGLPGYPPSGQAKAPSEDTSPAGIPEDAGPAGAPALPREPGCELNGGLNRELNGGLDRELNRDMLILCRFTGSRTDSLLLNLRKAGVPPIPLKAVVTSQNAGWTLSRLYEELEQEHEALHPSPGGTGPEPEDPQSNTGPGAAPDPAPAEPEAGRDTHD